MAPAFLSLRTSSATNCSLRSIVSSISLPCTEGLIQRSLGIRPSVQGNDIQLTIDLNLQLVAEEVLKDKKAGAIIVMDPRDGAIRAMTSKPTFLSLIHI